MITAFLGSIGVWLAPIIIVAETTRPFAFTPIVQKLSAAALHGDVLIVVPSLLAPLLLLLAVLKDNSLLRMHQISLVVLALIFGSIAVVLYVTKIANNVADDNLLRGASTVCFAASLFLLYFHSLEDSLKPETVLEIVRREGATVAEKLTHLRGEDT
jgi:hypothetical protein